MDTNVYGERATFVLNPLAFCPLEGKESNVTCR